MVTKGIITSIDFNGNTCQVRIPLFETAGNDPIISTAVVSNTPGSYNGYKVDDVVLVAFEDGKMETPVVIGKLYLGAEKEKADPRGSLNTESLVAAKTAVVPADTKLTTDTDKNLPNTMNPYANLSSIANNLNKLNTDVNYLDVFTNNQFSSVITDVNKQGEQLRSEIKQTASNIEANVVHKHQNGSQDALGWNLTTDSWKINAQDTVNGVAKDINIVTIDRSGMSIAGDLKLSGYPRNITVLYAQTGPNEDYPELYKFTEAKFPAQFPSNDEDKDKTWYYGKYIKITEAGEERYVLIFKENFEHYSITAGTTKAYSREINPEWKTETPGRVDGQYIWQWTHTEIYSFDEDKWDEQDDDKVVCITGADGKNGYNTVTVMLYKRSTASITGKQIDVDLYYKFSNQKLYTDDALKEEYKLPTGWSYTINGTGDSINGDLYCIAAVVHSNTDSDSIPHSEWAGPTLYVENGVSGTSVAQLTLYQRAASTPNNPTKDGTWTYNAANGSLTCDNKETKWKTSIPSETEPCYESHAAVLVTGLGTTTVTTWSEPAKFVENGADGKPGASTYTISIENDFDSIPADVNGNVSSSYLWQNETTHKVRVYYGKEVQDFVIVGPNETVSETGLCLKYKLTNVTLGNTLSVSNKVATAWINSLSADTGNILYTLYVDGVETGITGKFSATKIKSPAPTYTISIDNDFATIPTSTVNAKIYRKISNVDVNDGLFIPIEKGYKRDLTNKLPGMKLSAVTATKKLNDALLQTPAELIAGTDKSYVEDITKHNVTVYCNDTVETITTDNFIVKLDSDGLDADMDETQNYLVCELGGFDSAGTRATDFPGMNPAVNNNVVTNYITALSALGDTSESKNVYIQYTYYVKGEPVATAKFEVTRHTGPTTYYLSSNVSTIKVNKDAAITPNNVICTAYSLDTSTNTNTRFTTGTWKYKWDTEHSWDEKSTSLDLSINTAGVITNKYKQLYIELYLDNQLWDRETIDVIADGENAVDYRIIASSGTIKVTKTGNKEPQLITVDFKQINGSATPAAFSGNYKVFIDNGTKPISQGAANSIVLATSGATGKQIDISKAKSRVTVELYTTDGNTKLESETIDVVADGADGQPGVYIKEVKQWYILKASSFPESGQKPEDIKPADNAEPTYDPAPTSTTVDKWMSTPPEAVNDYVVWTCYGSIFSDDTSSKRHIEYSVPVKDNAYALAQGKTTNYYSNTDPSKVYSVKKGDCWFDTGYVKIDTSPENKAGYLGKFVIPKADSTTTIHEKDKIYVKAVKEAESNTNGVVTRYIQIGTDEPKSTYLVKITPGNIDKDLFTVKTEDTAGTDAYETGNLKQCSGFNKDTKKAIWKDIAGELVTNKLTANYINALDITTKKITVLQDNNDEQSQILFKADGTSKDGTVKIGGFDVKNNTLIATDDISTNLVQLMPDKILMQATKSAYWFKNTRTIEDAHSTYSYDYLFRYLETAANSGTWEDFSANYSPNDYDYKIYSDESHENNLVVVPHVEIYNKNTDTAIFTFYYSYLNSVTPKKELTDDKGNVITENFEIWIEVLPENSTNSPRRLLVPYGTTVINDGTYEYPTSTFITEANSTHWAKLDNNSDHYSDYSNYIYDNYTTYYNNYKSSESFNGVEYSYLQLKITKDIPTTFNIYLGISSNFNIAKDFDTVIALEPTDKDTPNFEFTEDSSHSFIESTDFILKASTSGNYVSGNLEDLAKVTYPSIVASEENPKYIYIIYVNRNNTNDENIEIIGSATETGTTVIDTAGFCVIPNLMTYSDSKLSIGSNFKVTPSGQLTAKNAIFEDNITLIGGGKLGAFELNNNKLSNSAMILDSTGVSLKDYKYLSIGNNKQFRLFKSQIDKSYVDTGGSSTNTKNMVDVSYMQSYHPIIIQKLTPSANSASSQSTASTLQGASILLTANDNTVTQYFRIKPKIISIAPIVPNPGMTLVKPKKVINNQIHTTYVTANSATIGTRYIIDFTVEVFEKVKDENGKETEKPEVAKKDYNFTFGAVFSSSMSIMSSIIKPCSIRVPKGRSSASTRYSWAIQGALYSFKGIKNTGGSTTKENLILTETFIDTTTDTSAIQLKSASIYLNGTIHTTGETLTASDRNLKENIKYLDYHTDYSNMFNYLKPTEFNYKNSNLTQFGFIAQDILEALPLLDETKKYSLVVKDNDHYAVDYNSIIALNTLQIKYLTNKLSQLETAYNELLKKVEDK